MGEEILDQLDVVRGERHQIASAAAHQIGRCQRIELAEGVDAHLGQQAEGHVVRKPGFQPMQRARERRHDGERDGEAADRVMMLERQHDQGRQHADTDERHHAQHAEGKGGGELALPRQDHLHQRSHHLVPGEPVGLDDAFGQQLHGSTWCVGNRFHARRRGKAIGRCAGARFAHLLGHQLGIDAAPGHQLIVAALFRDPAAVEHQDAVAVDDA